MQAHLNDPSFQGVNRLSVLQLTQDTFFQL